jgi:hypothetical protein
MIVTRTLEELVIAKTHRVPLPEGPEGDAATEARQLDAALMSAGFKLSGDLLAALSHRSPSTVIDVAGACVLPAVWRLVGDHVRHNTYFRDFPANVPDTVEFWMDRLRDALADPEAAAQVEKDHANGFLNLLALPKYGTYQHSYEEMLAAHAEFVPKASDRVTVLHLGGTLEEELDRLYLSLAESVTPLSEDDLAALRLLAARCSTEPDTIPVRENRALINEVRLGDGRPLLVDTVTDVLRLACALSGGDVTLQEPTRFRSLPRAHRRALLDALDRVVFASAAKLGDVHAHREAWKRLGERLHPHEHRYPNAAEVFATARGGRTARSFAGRIEIALTGGDFTGGLWAMQSAPGLLFRSLDRLLRLASTDAERASVVAAVADTVGEVSGRVVLSVREHLANRAAGNTAPRVFANRKGRAWVAADDRGPLDPAVTERLLPILDAEISRRLPRIEHLAVDRDLLDVALPLSDKATPTGFGILPRGSVLQVEGELLRFFCYWKETERTTDFDLSALITDGDGYASHLSYTNLTMHGGCHSGDITSAPNGASEFIDVDLSKMRHRYVIPQVNIYSGEGFEEVAESFFGFMLRDREQQGKPFEPRTVRMKSDLRGPNRVALPLVFYRTDDGWRARWMHLFLRGSASFNRVEDNRVSTWETVEGILARDHLTVRYLIERLAPGTLTILTPGTDAPEDATLHLGLDNLMELRGLIPA